MGCGDKGTKYPSTPHCLSRRQCRIETVEPRPAKIFQQPSQSPVHFGEICIMTDSRFQRRADHSRLTGINLPGMEVEDARTFVAACRGANILRRQGIGEQPEEAAA